MRAVPTVERTLLGRSARRTTAVAAALALALALTAAAVAQAARDLGARQAGLLPKGDSTIVVVDLSLSIPAVAYRRMATAIDAISRSGGSIGLVIFSDTAYELLPPGTPAAELRPLLRFLRPTERPPEVFADDRPYYLPDPWSETFRSGTRISRGIDLAREIAARDRVNAAVLLISDLHFSDDDRRALEAALGRLRAAGLPLRLVPLFPLPEHGAFFASHGASDVSTDWRRFASGLRPARAEAAQASVVSPLQLVLAGAALLALLAANELWCRRLDLPETA